MPLCVLSPANQCHDFQPITLGQFMLGVRPPRDQFHVYLDRDVASLHTKFSQQIGQSSPCLKVASFAIDENLHVAR